MLLHQACDKFCIYRKPSLNLTWFVQVDQLNQEPFPIKSDALITNI
jgi:hypothetical protein